MTNPFDWDYLTTPPTSGEVLGPFSTLYLVIFATGFIAAAYLYYRPWTKPVGTYVRRKTVRKASNMALWVFGTGMFFFLVRMLQINPFTFGERIWMYLSFAALLLLLSVFALRFRAARKATIAERILLATSKRHAARTTPVKRPVRRRTQVR
ncbi:MAG: hypothetical protein H0W23_08095 [Chloroflexia bacterium]|nr:hypothetical protein [Chloroflexia bacterium]